MTINVTAQGARQPLVSRLNSIPDAVLVVSLTCVALLTALRFIAFFVKAQGEFGYAAWVEDDFFYYSVIAENLAETGRSTFDGVTLSNGYHPLWMLICTAIAKIFSAHSAPFFVSIFLVQAALVAGGVWAFVALGRKAIGAGLLSSAGLMVGATVYGVALTIWGANGMEIALLAPLVPMLLLSAWTLCEKPNLRKAFIAAGLLCACILSRLDMVVVFAPLGLGIAALLIKRVGWAGTLRMTPALAAFIPLGLYVVLNIVVFGHAMPLSGQAKRLMIEGAGFGISEVAIGTFFKTPNLNYFISPVGVTLLTIAGASAVFALKRLRQTWPGTGFLLLTAGVALFYLQAVLTSDWMLWPWYFFPMMLTGAISAGFITDLVIAPAPTRLAPLSRWVAPVLCGALLAIGLKGNFWMLQSPPSLTNDLFTRVLPLREFALANPGQYAIGDGGGAAGFLIPGSVIQMEGLVNDEAYLEELKAGGSLNASLKRQNVDFYITSIHYTPGPGCVELLEPLQGGPRVSRMRETTCDDPVFTNRTGWVNTQIWDVRDGLK